jgi:multidrug transporter EmrE-like cation transporter
VVKAKLVPPAGQEFFWLPVQGAGFEWSMVWMWLALSIILGAVGQICMKLAMNRVGPVVLDKGIPGFLSYFLDAVLSIPLLSAVALYGTSFLLWLMVLSRMDLSVARPFTALGYFMVLIWGAMAGEAVTASRTIGVVLITAGVFFLLRR